MPSPGPPCTTSPSRSAAPEKVVEAMRGPGVVVVNEVGDVTAARDQVRERKADSAFVVTPTGEMEIYVAGGGGRSVATASEASAARLRHAAA